MSKRKQRITKRKLPAGSKLLSDTHGQIEIDPEAYARLEESRELMQALRARSKGAHRAESPSPGDSSPNDLPAP